MHIKMLFSGVVAVAGLVVAGPAHSQGALAEEVWSENFCQQAVSLAQQHGESPQALNQVNCQGMADNYQPSYWQCVIAAMKADARLRLDAARQKCLVGY
ncbi:MAG: hypothetical protein P9E24_10855 [Candidatus Competibacter sp.]|nr:hypothetical protein [Candidatus Competibacter sp.]MDG4585780.1 hypothetical protein [Candidatus Competibacter sp.]